MASPLMTKSSIYGSDTEQYGGSSPTPQAEASGGDMDVDNHSDNPIKAILLMIGVLIGIRFLWEAAKEVT